MKTYFGYYHPSSGIEPVECTVLVFDKNLNIGFRSPDGSNSVINWLLKETGATFDLPTQHTKLRNINIPGAELLIQGNDAASYIKEMQAEQKKAWYKKKNGKEWTQNGLLFLGILGALFLVYLLIVPWLSQKLASKVSIKTEKQLGDAVYDAMALHGQEDTAKSFVLNQFFNAMEVPTAYNIRITVVNDNVVNAFALPGGRIIVYSAMLKEITSYQELAALLSHEFIHVNNKHSTKSIFRRLGSKVFLGLLFGRFGTVTSVVVDHADDLKSLNYSRGLEKEADLEGLELLAKRGINPNGFLYLFQHLEESATTNSLPEFLGSHPDVKKRIAYIMAASEGMAVKENEQLKVIFEKLN